MNKGRLSENAMKTTATKIAANRLGASTGEGRQGGGAGAVALAVALSLGMVGGCANGPTTPRNQVNVLRNVQTGVVLDARPVTIEGTDTYIGKSSGAATGAILGREVGGGGVGGALAGVAVGTVGAVAGMKAEEMLTRTEGYEITIELDSGQTVSIIQKASDYTPSIGDPVILTGGNVRLNPNYP